MMKNMRIEIAIWIFFLVILGVFFAKILCSAQQDITFEEKIFNKLEEISQTQSEMQSSLNKILSSQEEIKKELGVIKIRATIH